MRLEKLPIRKLLPTESRLRWKNVISLNSEFDLGKVTPAVVVKYGRNYIMADGHSRSAILLFEGIEFAHYNILENDDDVRNCSDGLFGNKKIEDINTRGQFIDVYRNLLLPNLEFYDVGRFGDLLEGRVEVPSVDEDMSLATFLMNR